MARWIRRILEERFPGKAEVAYVDVHSEHLNDYPEVKTGIERGRLLPPVVAVNGRVVSEGSVFLDAIQAALGAVNEALGPAAEAAG